MVMFLLGRHPRFGRSANAPDFLAIQAITANTTGLAVTFRTSVEGTWGGNGDGHTAKTSASFCHSVSGAGARGVFGDDFNHRGRRSDNYEKTNCESHC
jgi:hypothetical protein